VPASPVKPPTTLEELALGAVAIVSELESLARVAQVLANSNMSCALIREQPLRVVTERDLARAWASECAPGEPIATIASEHPYWIPSTADIADAAAMMVHLGVRHLVVLDERELPLGVVAMSDLFALMVRDQEFAPIYERFAAVVVRMRDG
jgi:signal-transduction protein with cAMP-binding, CBS, and nucleotidyltransferase domain